MNIPEDLRYTKEHEWVKKRDEDELIVGITDYAQESLGDITYLELPELDAEITGGEPCGVIESVKTFSDLYAPVSGTIVEVNEQLKEDESLLNSSPYEEGWMFVVKMGDPSQWDSLMTAEQYAALVAEG